VFFTVTDTVPKPPFTAVISNVVGAAAHDVLNPTQTIMKTIDMHAIVCRFLFCLMVLLSPIGNKSIIIIQNHYI
jgi:hypothetical protein